MAASISDVRAELQLTTDDISDQDVTYAISKIGGNLNLACAVVLRMLLHKSRGRRQFTLGSFSETVDAKELRKQINYYKVQAGASMTEIEDLDFIFTVDGM